MLTPDASDNSNLGSVSVWLKGLPEGAIESQSELFRRYEPALLRYVICRLRQLGARLSEADDLVQEVFIGLFRRTAAGQMSDLNHRDQLWLKLKRICGDRIKDARRKRAIGTESALGYDSDGVLVGITGIPDKCLDDCLIAVEHSLLRLQLSLRHPDLPEIVRLKIQGLSIKEIADTLGTPKRTIERRLEWINEICDAYSRDGSA